MPPPLNPPLSLFLPLGEEAVERLAAGGALADFLKSASAPEQVALLLLLEIPTLQAKGAGPGQIERLLAQALGDLASGTLRTEHLATRLQRLCSVEVLQRTLPLLRDLGLGLLGSGPLAERAYLTATGEWDFGFSQRHAQDTESLRERVELPDGHALRTTTEQARLLREIECNLDDSCHIQGFAGVGKTHLMAHLLTLLPASRTLLLAQTPGQLKAMRARVKQVTGHEHLSAMTFESLAHSLLAIDRTRLGWRVSDPQRTQRTYSVSDSQIAQWLHLMPVGRFAPVEVAAICRRAVTAFCLSDSTTVEDRHLPALGLHLQAADRAMLTGYASRYWNELVSPSEPHLKIPVRSGHLIKILSLRQEAISDRISHVLVDESHELTQPLISILERGGQAIISLGDNYQNLTGFAARHGPQVRPRYLTQSVRAGSQMERVLNPLIQTHSATMPASYEGRAAHDTRVVRFGQLSIPSRPTTLIVESVWDALNLTLRFIKRRSPFRLAAGTRQDVELFAGDLIELYRVGTRPRHRLLFQYGAWQYLMEEHYGQPALQTLERALEDGLDADTFRSMMEALCVNYAPITIARVEDVKNQEFDSVMVIRDLQQTPNSARQRRSVCSKLYTAASRARYELFVPGGMDDWLQDVATRTRGNDQGV